MKKAWQDPPGILRDICQGDVTSLYHPDIAALYLTDVPDDAVNGATLVDGVWTNPQPPPPPAADELAAIAVAQAQAASIAAEVAYQATVPLSVTMRQARLALLGAGLLAMVETAIAGAGPAAKIEWEYATEVHRSAGLVPQMAIAFGMTELQIDALFITASAL